MPLFSHMQNAGFSHDAAHLFQVILVTDILVQISPQNTTLHRNEVGAG